MTEEESKQAVANLRSQLAMGMHKNQDIAVASASACSATIVEEKAVEAVDEKMESVDVEVAVEPIPSHRDRKLWIGEQQAAPIAATFDSASVSPVAEVKAADEELPSDFYELTEEEGLAILKVNK